MKHLSMDPAFAPLVKHPREVLENASAVRARVAAAPRRGEEFFAALGVTVEDRQIPFSERADGAVPIRVYRPVAARTPLPALLYLHGGGFFCGGLASDEFQCAHYASAAACVVVCVDYRLSPEHPFPAALRDCDHVLQYLLGNTEPLHLRRETVAIGGSSAGGNLAAALTLLMRDRGQDRLCFQMLLVPALDDRLQTLSAQQFVDTPDFARPEAETMWRWYLAGSQAVSALAAPARADTLAGLPPAYLLCAGLDPLRDEGLIYAERLMAAGVPTELHLIPGLPHGFSSVPAAPVTQRLLREQVEVLRAALHPPQHK